MCRLWLTTRCSVCDLLQPPAQCLAAPVVSAATPSLIPVEETHSYGASMRMNEVMHTFGTRGVANSAFRACTQRSLGALLLLVAIGLAD